MDGVLPEIEPAFSVSRLLAASDGTVVSGEPSAVTFLWIVTTGDAHDLNCVFDAGDGSEPARREGAGCAGPQIFGHSYDPLEESFTAKLTVTDADGIELVRSRDLGSSSGDNRLELINELRSTTQKCGEAVMEPVAPLRWDERLAKAAQLHSEFMAETDDLSHSGRGGSSPAQRIVAEGYQYRYVAENVSAGYPTFIRSLAGLMGSPGHCKNIMSPLTSDFGAGYAQADSGRYRHYWTQNFASEF